MPLEATVVCIDNSEYSRNGDYAPSRFQAQADAINLLAGAKTQHHPENTVGVMSMAGVSPTVMVTPTGDLGKVLQAMQGVEIDGTEARLAVSIQIAQLTLKHRENKNQRQRIVVFIGSPIVEDVDALVKLGKKLKKNNVSVDVVSFGCDEENKDKLEAFHAAVNSGDTSHLVTVPSGTILSDMLFATPIFMEEGAGGPGGAEGGTPARQSLVVDGFDYGELGVDPALDPELAMALRMSVEEERARQARDAAAAGVDGEGGEGQAAEGQDGEGKSGEGKSGVDPEQQGRVEEEQQAGEAPMEMDEDALLQQALALSMQGAVAEPATDNATTAANEAAQDAMLMEGIDDPELQEALALSMQMAEDEAKNKGGNVEKEEEK
jgi:26S proteasome regulatory subunit N10